MVVARLVVMVMAGMVLEKTSNGVGSGGEDVVVVELNKFCNCHTNSFFLFFPILSVTASISSLVDVIDFNLYMLTSWGLECMSTSPGLLCSVPGAW